MPPRIVTIKTPPAAHAAGGARDRHGRSTVRPPMDWTGHAYPAVSELRVDYAKTGRDRATGKPPKGRSDFARTMPVMPGMGRNYNS